MKLIVPSDLPLVACPVVPPLMMEDDPGNCIWAAFEVLAEFGGCWIRDEVCPAEVGWADEALVSSGVGLIYTDADVGAPSLDMVIALPMHPVLLYALSSIRLCRSLGRAAPISNAWWGGLLRRWLEPSTHRSVTLAGLGPALMISERACAVRTTQIPTL